MNSKIFWITYKNVPILYTNWSNFPTEKEFLDATKETTNFVVEQNLGNLLELVDVTDSVTTTEIIKASKEAAILTKPFNKKKAVIGISGLKRILLNAVNRIASEKIVAFETKEQALEWLIKL